MGRLHSARSVGVRVLAHQSEVLRPHARVLRDGQAAQRAVAAAAGACHQLERVQQPLQCIDT
jgi:hypothetical protein